MPSVPPPQRRQEEGVEVGPLEGVWPPSGAVNPTRLQAFFELCFPDRRAFEEDTILNEISRPLRQEVCLHKCRSVLSAMELLRSRPYHLVVVDAHLPGMSGCALGSWIHQTLSGKMG